MEVDRVSQMNGVGREGSPSWPKRANRRRRFVETLEDPENQNPENQDPENQDPENQDPENQDPENQDPESQDPENQSGAEDSAPGLAAEPFAGKESAEPDSDRGSALNVIA